MITAKDHSRKLSLLVALFILLAGVFLGGYFVLKSGRAGAGQLDDILKGETIDLVACNPEPKNPDKDADSDGLTDWQEIQLYLSDPCKKDTDADGYLDGEETASGYDPTKKAPGDELPGTTPKGPRPLPENLTRALSSMLAQQVGSGKIDSFNKQGQILSAAELEKYPGLQRSVQQIMSAGEQLFAPEPVDDSQIKTTQDNSRPAIQRYAGEVSEALALPPSQAASQESEMSFLLKTVENNDFSRLKQVLANYQTAYQNLKDINQPVPTDLLALHKEQLAMLSSLIKVYQALANGLEEDPLKTNLALQKYQVISLELTEWLQELSRVIQSH